MPDPVALFVPTTRRRGWTQQVRLRLGVPLRWFDVNMASLLDPLPDDVHTLVRVAADGYAAAGSRWPYWQ